jgi:HEPN domain-containing protein
MKRSTKEWLKSAQEDLLVMECLMDNRLATGAASFHAQQCVEKSLKAILEENGEKITKIHDLEKLFSMTNAYIQIKLDEKLVTTLNTLYIESRYPGALGLLPHGKPSINDVREFYAFAKNIFGMVKKQLA